MNIYIMWIESFGHMQKSLFLTDFKAPNHRLWSSFFKSFPPVFIDLKWIVPPKMGHPTGKNSKNHIPHILSNEINIQL